MSDSKKLAGKVAIVTASTDGIGFAIAKRLCQDGAKVMISSRKQNNVDRALKSLRDEGLVVSGTVCHAANKEHRQKMIEKTLKEFGGIDILVSTAAVNPATGRMFDVTEEQWDKIMEVNVKATFFLCKEVVPHMEKRGGGSIILLSSVSAYSHSEIGGVYCVSKLAMVGLVKTMVFQLSKMNIRVNGIAPGLIPTKFSGLLWKNDFANTYMKSIPLERAGKPDECAGIASLLASDDSSYITGETIVVAGGAPSRL